jgi:hypothetical protein
VQDFSCKPLRRTQCTAQPERVEKTMNNSTHNDACVFLLPENSFHSLSELRDLMFLMSSITYAATEEEEKILLHLSRSSLAQCFQIFAIQLADALDATQQRTRMESSAMRMH